MVNAQEWLSKEYLVSRRNEITELDISKGKVKRWDGHERTLKGDLKLEGFTNLRVLRCSGHELTKLDLSECEYLIELDCQSNQLNSLNVGGCLHLEKINCSNNFIRDLDLNACVKLREVNFVSNNFLEEVDVSKCSKLDKIGFGFTRDDKKHRLVKVSQTVLAGDDIRNILVIGITGNGKSALTNVLTNETDDNKFGESSSGTSATKIFQISDVFEYQGKKYRIIDNIGFGDTAKIAKEDILFKIGEGIYSAKEGISQVLFVFKGRFSPEHVEVFNLFKDFISETGITRFTTLVRTNFENFRVPEECEEDRRVLLTQSLELTEIVNSCNGTIHVDNPPLPIVEDDDDEEIREEKEEEMSINKEKRKDSRKIILDHLSKNCPEIYKLKEWDSIHQQVANCMKKIEENKGKLVKSDSISEKTRLQDEIKESKGKVIEEVNAMLTAEISAFPRFIAQIEMKNPNFWPFNKK